MFIKIFNHCIINFRQIIEDLKAFLPQILKCLEQNLNFLNPLKDVSLYN